jgi:DNA repair exonuclease SbcCD ATPase subunit
MARARDKRPVNIYLSINVFMPGAEDVEDANDDKEHAELMAKVDEVQASLDELEGAIRDFLDSAGGNVSQLQQELETLRADDAVEDSKLDGIRNGIQNITQAVRQLASTEPPEGTEPFPQPDQTLPGDLPPQQGG